tara:strand:- start:688 stop:1272 length:585 start_codon:yes stop_codon:yes gene_type:complete
MTFYYQGAAILAPFTITSNEPTYETDTVSLVKQRASQGAQRWEMTFSTMGSADTEAQMLVSAITNLTTSATLIMPQIPSVVAGNTSSVSLVINANAAAGVSAVTIVNDGTLKQGSFIKFSNSDKVYMVTADAVAGTVAVSIYPRLRTAVTTSDMMRTGDSALFTYYRDINSLKGLTYSDGLLSNSGTITLIEAV